jgi:hypothetical protein
MEGKSSKLSHPRQGIHECFWGEISKLRDVMELKIYESRRRKKKLRECRNGDPSQMQGTEAYAPLESAR